MTVNFQQTIVRASQATPHTVRVSCTDCGVPGLRAGATSLRYNRRHGPNRARCPVSPDRTTSPRSRPESLDTTTT